MTLSCVKLAKAKTKQTKITSTTHKSMCQQQCRKPHHYLKTYRRGGIGLTQEAIGIWVGLEPRPLAGEQSPLHSSRQCQCHRNSQKDQLCEPNAITTSFLPLSLSPCLSVCMCMPCFCLFVYCFALFVLLFYLCSRWQAWGLISKGTLL